MGQDIKRQISWAITNRCFLACDHCLAESSPSGASMDAGSAARVAGHMPRDGNYSLEITGGDPFSDLPLLRQVLRALGGPRKGRRVTIHTTGHWAVDDEGTRETLRGIKELGADGLDFLCDDEIHRDAGLSSENYRRAVRVTRNVFGPDGVFVRRPDLSEGIIPIGRGAAAHMKPSWGRTECEVRGARISGSMQLHVSHTGAAYVCLNGVAPPVGSMVHSSYEEIIEVVKNDAWHNALMESGPLGLAIAAGMDGGRWQSLIDQVGECRACIELTRDLASRHPSLDAEGE